jgi:ribosomal protein L1
MLMSIRRILPLATTQLPACSITVKQKRNRRVKDARRNRILKESTFVKSIALQQLFGKKNVGEEDEEKRVYKPLEALEEVLAAEGPKGHNEAIDVAFRLGIDKTKSEQNVRGMVILPGGAVRQEKICVLTSPDFEDIARQAGADLIATEQTLKDIEEGRVEFSKMIATTECLPNIRHLARKLGPLGLFPNAKSGTLVPGS